LKLEQFLIMSDDTAAALPSPTNAAAAAAAALSMTRKDENQPAKKHTSADVTRRMVCGGLAGMIAKVCM
jgi:hypothetical protein